MILTSILSSPLLLSILITSRKFQNSIVERRLKEIDSHLEKVYDFLRSDNHKKACLEASKAFNLIEQNYNNLKLIEPQHNWHDIKNVLLDIPLRHCEN